MISRLHYLTQDLEQISHVDLIEEACGLTKIDWIQLRVKSKEESEVLAIAKAAREICTLWNVKLILNDYVHIAKQINADGVHLGKSDMPIEKARAILGTEKIIGGTANTFEDIKKLYQAGVNYVGVGPYKFTTTKENLSNILGLEGYQDILKQCIEANISIPIIAIGGIQLYDVVPLLATGVHGIAIASAINLSDDRAETAEQFLKEIEEGILKRN